MSKKSPKVSSKSKKAKGELNDEELDKVTGAGIVPETQLNQVASPRDPASGLPTGLRMNKPFVSS